MSWLDKILPSRIRATKDEKGSFLRVYGINVLIVDQCFTQLSLIKISMFVLNVITMKEFQQGKRINIFLDKGEHEEMFVNLSPKDMLKFKDKQKYQG
jgi:acetyl-CoA carboxylase beta subunit